MGEPRPGATAHSEHDPLLAGANAALRTLAADLAMADQTSAATSSTRTPGTPTWAATWPKLLHDIPHVVTSHSLEPQRPWKAEQLGGGYRVSSWAERTAYEAADAVIAVSHGSRRDVHGVVPGPRRVEGARRAQRDRHRLLPPRPEHRGARTARRRPEPAVGGVRRADHASEGRAAPPARGAAVRPVGAARAARRRRRHPRAGGRDRRRGRRRCAPTATPCSSCPRCCPRDEVRQVLTHGTVFVCPSVYEPLGIVNLEAMACETAVVASDVGGIPEVVADGETGLLVHYDADDTAGFEADLAARRERPAHRPGPGDGDGRRRAAARASPSSAGTPPPAGRWRSTSPCSDTR